MISRSKAGGDVQRNPAQPATKPDAKRRKAPAKPASPAKPAAEAKPKRPATKSVAPAAPTSAAPEATTPQPSVLEAVPLAETVATAVAAPQAEPAAAPVPAPAEFAVPVEPMPAAVEPMPAASGPALPVEPAEPPLSSQETVMPAEPTATSPGRIATCEPPETTFPWPPQSHPLAVFLSDVLEGLLGEDTVRLDIAAAPETHGLAMEKLFCFSQALHLLLLPLPVARESPGHGRGPADALPVLRVRLTQREDRRYSLHLYDDGRFFRRRFPELRLDAEWLRPLLLFVAKRQGSLLIKQGRAVAFEIIC